MITETNCLRIMKEWYGKPVVAYNCVFTVPICRREFSTMPSKAFSTKYGSCRYMKCTSTKSLSFFLHKWVRVWEYGNVVNLFYSLAKYKTGVPDTGVIKAFHKKVSEDWRVNHWKSIESVDLMIDVDCPKDPKTNLVKREFMCDCKEDVRKITEFLDSFTVPYYVRFSGAGYHIIIHHSFFKHETFHYNPDEPGNVWDLYENIAEYFHDKFTEFIDLGINDSRRITKLPYTLVFYPDGCYVCWPFKNKTEFLMHDYTDYKINDKLYFPGFENMYNRGQTCFNHDASFGNEEKLCNEFLRKIGVTHGSKREEKDHT